jgi:hypothetical protein
MWLLFMELFRKHVEWANWTCKFFEKISTDICSLQYTNYSDEQCTNDDIEAADLLF